ncbi:M56 family metallopeptidase [Thermoactinospora rubra]|uniref:M56 family metallopeptidase n=1 Tax=Thermoactinospora rubra TaxID=1088767 RepID=UPI00117D56B3|nr:M56 family metallopeptidase [Thermoactinospora rubra]
MIAGVLAVYAVLATTLLPRLLIRARWADRAPRLAITLWLAACTSAIASAALSAVAAAIPPDAIGHSLASLIEACFAMLDDGVDLGTMSAGSWLVLLSGGLVVARAAYGVGAVMFTAWRERRRHAEMLRILGRRDHELDAIVLEYGEPLAYCLPGRQAKTVVTTAALQALTPEHLAAVLAHERAHLRGRHHLVLALADGLDRAFPGVPLFSRAKEEVVRLVELRADDVAAHRHPRVHIAAALVSLATGRAPAFALGAGGENALTRVRRMLRPAVPLGQREKLAGVTAVGVLLAGPAVVMLFPGLTALIAHHCHDLFVF